MSKTYSIVFLCAFVIASCNGEEGSIGMTSHEFIKRHIEARQLSNDCWVQLNQSAPRYCNLSLLVSGADPSPINDAQLAALNTAYATQFCIPECVYYIEAYFRCTDFLKAVEYFTINFTRNHLCGQYGGDYCIVRSRRTKSYLIYDQINRQCSVGDGDIFCDNYTSPSCINNINSYNDNMGCCSEPRIGPGVYSCAGTNVDQPCAGVTGTIGTVSPTFTRLTSSTSSMTTTTTITTTTIAVMPTNTGVPSAAVACSVTSAAVSFIVTFFGLLFYL